MRIYKLSGVLIILALLIALFPQAHPAQADGLTGDWLPLPGDNYPDVGASGSWQTDVTGMSITGAVYDVEFIDGKMYVAGNFDGFDGNNSIRFLAVWDGNAWSSPVNSSGFDSHVRNVIDIGDGYIYVAGRFLSVDGVAGTKGLARLNKSTGQWESVGGGITSGNYISNMVADGQGNLYAIGDFTRLGNGPVDTPYIARWNGNNWERLGGSQFLANVPASIYYQRSSNRVYIGTIQSGGLLPGQPESALVYYDIEADRFATAGSLQGRVWAIAEDYADGSLLIGGQNFVAYPPVNGAHLLRHRNGQGFEAVATATRTSGAVWVSAIWVDPAYPYDYYVGGTFNTIEGITANSLAKYDRSSQGWSSPETAGATESIGGGTGYVNRIKAFSGDNNVSVVFVAGYFDTPSPNLALWSTNGVMESYAVITPVGWSSYKTVTVFPGYSPVSGPVEAIYCRERGENEGVSSLNDLMAYGNSGVSSCQVEISQNFNYVDYTACYENDTCEPVKSIQVVDLDNTPPSPGYLEASTDLGQPLTEPTRVKVRAGEDDLSPVVWLYYSDGAGSQIASVLVDDWDTQYGEIFVQEDTTITYFTVDLAGNRSDVGTMEITFDNDPSLYPSQISPTPAWFNDIWQNQVEKWTNVDLIGGTYYFNLYWGPNPNGISDQVYSREDLPLPELAMPENNQRKIYYLRYRPLDENYEPLGEFRTIGIFKYAPAVNSYRIMSHIDDFLNRGSGWGLISMQPLSIDFFFQADSRFQELGVDNIFIVHGNVTAPLPTNKHILEKWSIEGARDSMSGPIHVDGLTIPYTVDVYYFDELKTQVDVNSIRLAYWNEAEQRWNEIEPVFHNYADQTISFQIDHFSEYVLYANSSFLCEDGKACVTVLAGNLTVMDSNIDLGSFVLDGYSKIVENGPESPFVAIDARGSGQGWTVSLVSTDFVNGDNRTIPAINFGVKLPANQIVTVDGNQPPQTLVEDYLSLEYPVILMQALPDTGMGKYQFNPMFRLFIPADVFAGIYHATLTVTITGAP